LSRIKKLRIDLFGNLNELTETMLTRRALRQQKGAFRTALTKKFQINKKHIPKYRENFALQNYF